MAEVYGHIERWAKDPDPAVRAAAVHLLADFPKEADRRLLEAAAKDDQAIVRAAAAMAIGYGQFQQQVPLLAPLIDDADKDAARAAAMSLLSFSLDTSREILKQHVGDNEFSPLFVNALAAKDPDPYLDQLADVIRQERTPKNWWGGRVPWGVSWEILYRYAQSGRQAEIRRARKVLDALEIPSLGLEGAPDFYSSSEPRDL